MRSELDSQLQQLRVEYPLTTSWKIDEVFFEDCQVADQQLYMLGLAGSSSDGMNCVASTVSSDFSTLQTAYFEFLERTILIGLQKQKNSTVQIRNYCGEIIEKLPLSEVFPEPQEKSYVYSKSSGAAIHRSFLEARDSAFFELLERDRILRSWFGEFQPQRIPIESLDRLCSLQEQYELYPSATSQARRF